jgi:hypothetical protein
MKPPVVAALSVFAAAVLIWHRAGKRRQPSYDQVKLTWKERALLLMMRAGSHKNAAEPGYQDREQP